jgi:hypothetical protein
MEIKPKVYDCFFYNGEEDILELRLNILGSVVDEFRIVECVHTFCGKEKPIYLKELPARFEKWRDKIKLYINDDKYYLDEFLEAYNSPNTGKEPRWINEFRHKEYIKNTLIGLDDNDILFIGDVDEIWSPELSQSGDFLPIRLEVYQYYLNLHSTERFWGTMRGTVKDFRGKCINHLRKNQYPTDEPCQGWHFTSQGGLENLYKKIDDQYNKELFNVDLKNQLAERFGKVDFINRPFILDVDETRWPEFIKNNREKFAHLCK